MLISDSAYEAGMARLRAAAAQEGPVIDTLDLLVLLVLLVLRADRTGQVGVPRREALGGARGIAGSTPGE